MDILQLNAPSGWKVSTVGESYIICNQLREPISATVRESMKGEYPYYGPTQVVDYLDHYRLDGKYALIGEDGDHFLKYATRPMTQLATGKFNVNNHAHIIQSTEDCSVEWFYYFFMHTSIFPFLTRQGAGRYKLNKAALEQIPILIPPLAEQHKIAEILSTWDEAIDLTEQLIAAKQRRKQALMQRLLTGQVRFPGFEDEWERTKLERICVKFLNGGTPSTSNKSFWDGNIPWITGADIVDQKITSVRSYVTEEGVRNSATNVIEKGNLLVVTRTGVGKLAIAPFDLAISQDLTGVYVNPEKVIPTFLFYYLDFRVPLLTRLNQGTSINGITRQTLVATEIALPSKEEQERLISVFEACDAELTLHHQKLAALRRQKGGLMQQLLTGRLRVVG